MENEEITITLKVKKGGIRIKHGDVYGIVVDDNGETVGGMGACLGGSYEARIGDDSYYFEPNDFWNAICAAIGKEEYIF